MALSRHLLFNLDLSLPLKLYFKKGDVRFALFPFHVFVSGFVYEIKGSEVCMSMSDHTTKQRLLQEFFANKVSFSWKTGFCCFTRVG